MSDRQKPKSVSGKLRKGKETTTIGSGARTIIEELKKGNGWGEFGKMAGFENGKIILPGVVFAMRLQVLGELSRPDNPSPYMIEYVRVGKTIFLRLVEKPPREVLEAMVREGVDNYSSSNDISSLIEGLGDSVMIHAGEAFRPSRFPRHPRNPFKRGSGYGILVDIAAAAGARGIDEESWRRTYCGATGKDNKHAGYDLAVIKSSIRGRRRHSCCRPGFTVVEHGGRYSIRFD